MTTTVRIEDVVVRDRHRRKVTFDTLAESIRRVGLIHPIVIDSENVLVAGERRLLACRSLGWEEVEATVVDLSDVDRLIAERDENLERVQWTTSEKVAVAQEIERIEAAKNPPGRRPKGKGAESAPLPEKGKARDKAAAAVGLSHDTVSKAKKVVEAAEADPDKIVHVDPETGEAQTAADVLDEMDKTGNVAAAVKKVLAAERETIEQPSDAEKHAILIAPIPCPSCKRPTPQWVLIDMHNPPEGEKPWRYRNAE